MMAATLYEQASFSSFQDFEEALTVFQRTHSTQFALKSSEKLNHETDSLFPVFKYNVLRYVCKQGCRIKKPLSHVDSGQRPKQRSYKVGCPVMMNVRLNRPKGKEPFLKVTKLLMDHENHEVSEQMFQLYPEQRRLNIDETTLTVLTSKTMKTSEKKEILEKRHQTPILNHDIYNIGSKIAAHQSRDSDEERCFAIIKEEIDNGGAGTIAMDSNGDFLYCTFQSVEMRSLLETFPQCLIMDCTYKVNHYLYPLLTIMCIDGEGHGMPVFHAFLSREDRHILELCLKDFSQQYNKDDIACFVVDKDLAEIAAISAIFPNVPVNLCNFHVSQAVDRFLRKELGRGAPIIRFIHDLFMAQVTTESENEFDDIRRKISQVVPQSVIDYFQLNWWSKKNLWAACCNVNVVKLHATTTNALESYHSKIKKTVNEKLSLSNTLKAILSFNKSKITESFRQKLIAANCDIYDLTDQSSLRAKITRAMSRFAGDMVKNELSLSEKNIYTMIPLANDGLFQVCYKDRTQQTSVDSCTCSTFGHMKLPCRHIFFVRQQIGQNIFDEALIPERFRTVTAAVFPSGRLAINVVDTLPPSFRTVEGRFRKAKSVCDGIVNFMSVLGEREFGEKLGQLQDLIKSWSSVGDVETNTASVPAPSNSGPLHVDQDVPLVDTNTISGSFEQAEDPTVTSDMTENISPASESSYATSDVPVASAYTESTSEASADINVEVEAPVRHAEIAAGSPENSSSGNSWPKMSRLFKPRGRPCTKQSFTSKLSRKRCRDVPKTFDQLTIDQQAMLLVKAISCRTTESARLIQVHELKPLNQIGDIVMEERVDISCVQRLFDAAAWQIVEDAVALRRQENMYFCGQCNEIDNHEYKMIQCEHCLVWHHFHCVGYSSKKKVATWFCDACM